MFVLPSDDYDCLLGLNWFLDMKVSISPAERTLKFESETYSLDDDDFLYEPEYIAPTGHSTRKSARKNRINK